MTPAPLGPDQQNQVAGVLGKQPVLRYRLLGRALRGGAERGLAREQNTQKRYHRDRDQIADGAGPHGRCPRCKPLVLWARQGDHQGVALDAPVTAEPFEAVGYGPRVKITSRPRTTERFEHRTAGQVQTDFGFVKRVSHEQRAIAADQNNRSLFADIEGSIIFLEVAHIDGSENNAGKAAVGIIDPSCQRYHPLVGDPVADRITNTRLPTRIIAVEPKIFAIPYIGPRRFGKRSDNAVSFLVEDCEQLQWR